MNVRWTKYKNKAFSDNPERGNFYDDMRSYSVYDSNGNLDKQALYKEVSRHFRRILIDCQYGDTQGESEELGAISEEFYTIFVNRDMTSKKDMILG